MKKGILGIAVAVIGIGWLASSVVMADGAKYKQGQKVADFALKDDNGRTVKLSDYRGKVIILNFYASW